MFPVGRNSSCDLFDDPTLCETTIIVKRVFAGLSVLGCFLMLLIIILYKKYSTFVQRIILYMACAALLSAVGYIMGDTQPAGPLCSFQGFFMNAADWSLLLWMCVITLALFASIVKDRRVDQREWIYHVICWGFPLVVSSLPLIVNAYAPAGAWCWIADRYWQFGIWFIPLFVLLAVMVIMYSYMVHIVHRRVKAANRVISQELEQSYEMKLQEIRPLRAYPFIYLLLNVFPLINRIENAVTPSTPGVFWLTLLHVASISMTGAVYAVVFGLTKETMQELRISNLIAQIKSRILDKATIVGKYEPQLDDVPPLIREQ